MRTSRLLWFGLLGAPLAWAAFHVAGFALTEAECQGGGIAFSTWTAVLTAVAAAVAAGSIVASALAWRRTRNAGDSPPGARQHFLSVMGMTVAPLVLVIILMSGIGALVLAPCAQGAPGPQQGAELFATDCASCHGSRGDGMAGRAPSLRGAGAAAADFYLSTGYMPLEDPEDQPERDRPRFTPAQRRALVRYIAALQPGGPPVPSVGPGDVADGQELFTEHCAGCHQVVGEGGVVTGARVPPLDQATPTQIAEAVRIGPYVMPRFSEKAISDAELEDIVAYVRYAQDPEDPGGFSINHLGPVPEGMIAWLVAMVVLVLVCVAIGSRVRS